MADKPDTENTNSPNAPAETPSLKPSQQPNPQPSRKILYTVLGVISLLIVILIVLLALVLTKKDNDQSNNQANNQSNQQQENNQDDQSDDKKVVKTVNTNQANVKLLVYEPIQSGGNTKVNFALKYDCNNCGDDSDYVSMYETLGMADNMPDDIYALDNDNSQKYGALIDKGENEQSKNDDVAVVSGSCAGSLKPGEQLDCFATFVKIPSNSTVSLVLGDKSPTVDGIRIP